MKFSVLLLSVLISIAGLAQAQWKVKVNNKLVMTASAEDEQANNVQLKKAQLKNKKDFFLTYTEETKKRDWERTIMVYDEKDHEVARQKGTQLKLKNSTLLTYFKGAQKLKIFTIALPADPKLKAAIRVRRVHLCTLVLQ